MIVEDMMDIRTLDSLAQQHLGSQDVLLSYLVLQFKLLADMDGEHLHQELTGIPLGEGNKPGALVVTHDRPPEPLPLVLLLLLLTIIIFFALINYNSHNQRSDGIHVLHILEVTGMRGSESRTAQGNIDGQLLILEHLHWFGMAIADHPDLVLHKQEPGSLRDVGGRLMEAKIGLKAGLGYLHKDLAVIDLMELISHNPVVAGELKHLFHHRIAQLLHAPPGSD